MDPILNINKQGSVHTDVSSAMAGVPCAAIALTAVNGHEIIKGQIRWQDDRGLASD